MRTPDPKNHAEMKAISLLMDRVAFIAVTSSKELNRDRDRAKEDAVIAVGTFLSAVDIQPTQVLREMMARTVRSCLIRVYGTDLVLIERRKGNAR